ncbi:AAA family ATPase [Methanosphaerula palustris]|uniref:ATPase associated with various cellular activities AAA_3 n=1 Tax=Methanosphaerula palustris (strain ATCC BAA-1556 / DSM 19958 / E1-9c) TaxID=521011 RepID=B8GJV9_METPE|nr:MoxR family ATPase [Methanosphaerula palustris]ACL15763.1 ATPase associated with various cellular activities AAA_3 [Methanosphaerula palustris E1-9c]
MEQKELEREVRAIADARRVTQETLGRFVVGNQDLVDLILVGVLTGGHVLIDGVPGTAKTTISKIVARLIGYQFSRVQGAVDVQPTDIVGIRIYDNETHKFSLQKGPIFANFVMIDEINRLTPKTQSAFIEAMAEHQATIDGKTYPIESPFFVIATQNTQEFEGTFHLIEAQRDRFNYSMSLYHLGRENEAEILRRDRDGHLDWDVYGEQIAPILSIARVQNMTHVIQEVYVDDAIIRYISDIVVASRNHGDIRLGTSTRGSLALLRGAMASAALAGRTYVIPDDVKRMARPVLGHRLILEREAEIGKISADDVVQEILETVEVA